MPATLNFLPFDIIHAISILLDIQSYINLGRTNRRLYELLQDENAARRCLEHNAPYHKHASKDLYATSGFSARRILSVIFDQRGAVRTANPCSVAILAYGSDFVYSNRILCYMCADQIRILDTSYPSRQERSISGQVLGKRLSNSLRIPNLPDDLLGHTTLLGLANDILVLLCEEVSGSASWLIALNVRDDDPVGPCNRLRLRRRLVSKAKLFVRHNHSYLYYGTHSASRDDGHHEWQIQGCDLKTGQAISPKSLRFHDFVGSEVGSTACFEIHDEHFYAVSNQTSFDTEEVDWTSSYHYVRFKLNDKAPDLKLHKIWRRQHHEGPINDAWTELALTPDERNNELKITEVRREWLGGGSRCTRTAYTSSFRDTTDEELGLGQLRFPAEDQLSRTLDECSRPEYTRYPPNRIEKHCHPEYTAEQDQTHEFIRAKTKHHSYNSSAHAFLDLVADEIRMPNPVRSKDRLRLRVASRVPDSPLVPDLRSSDPTHMRTRPQSVNRDGEAIPDSEEAFTDTTVQLWPAADAPAELFELLCPGGRVGPVHAVADEQSIVYTAGTPNPQYGNQRAIIMISFDPRWGHAGLKRLPGTRSGVRIGKVEAQRLLEGSSMVERRAGPDGILPGLACDVVMGNPDPDARIPKRALERLGGGGGGGESSASASKRQRAEDGASWTVSGQQRLLWTERAMYLDINQGIWLS